MTWKVPMKVLCYAGEKHTTIKNGWLRKKKLFDIQHPQTKLFDNFSCGNPFSKSGSGSNVADLKMRFSQ